jgi:RNA polymerase sigma-70 factor, ECF subfamily
MDVEHATIDSFADPRYADAWRDHREHLLNTASRMLHDSVDAEDVVQDAFARLAQIDIAELDDVRGWLAVVVRRICLDRIRSAYRRRESPAGAVTEKPLPGDGRTTDPADRVTFDDEVQLALAIVLDRLSPAERTAFVLHDVFGFSFTEIGAMVSRSPAACRQLASRARRTIRDDTPAATNTEASEHRLIAERFIAACEGGDIGELIALLDPQVVGEATLLGHGPMVRLAGRPAVAQRLLGLLASRSDIELVPVALERGPGIVVFQGGGVRGMLELEIVGGLVRHLRAFVRTPT